MLILELPRAEVAGRGASSSASQIWSMKRFLRRIGPPLKSILWQGGESGVEESDSMNHPDYLGCVIKHSRNGGPGRTRTGTGAVMSSEL